MGLVRLSTKTSLDPGFFDNEYSTLAAEIELMREYRQKLKEAEAEQFLRVNRIKEIEDIGMHRKRRLRSLMGALSQAD